MRGVASILAQTQAADPDRFAAVESMMADVKRRGRSDNGLLAVPIHYEMLIAG
ncbi:MAG: hypothetical protein JWP25_1275 [Bradyrhizobium sp.]|jgi:hypothetical protein|nr:hypothetical protein [Bradyrhizobium sp.]